MGGVGCHTGGMAGGRAGLGCARYDATRRSPDVLLPRVRQGRDSVRWGPTSHHTDGMVAVCVPSPG